MIVDTSFMYCIAFEYKHFALDNSNLYIFSKSLQFDTKFFHQFAIILYLNSKQMLASCGQKSKQSVKKKIDSKFAIQRKTI